MDFRYEEAARYKAKYCTVMGFTSLPEKVGELVKSHGVKQVYMECEELSVAQARTLEKAPPEGGGPGGAGRHPGRGRPGASG